MASISRSTDVIDVVQCLDKALVDDVLMVGGTINIGSKIDQNENVYENVLAISNMPLLDQITITSEGSDTTSMCDISSVTTIEDENDDQDSYLATPTPTTKTSLQIPQLPNSSLRTMFDRYWEKNNMISPILQKTKILPHTATSNNDDHDDTSSVNTYERVLRQHQPKATSSTTESVGSSITQRRQIFPTGIVLASSENNGAGHSTNSSLSLPERWGDAYEGHSDPSLCKKKRTSCLRRSRFSISFTETKITDNQRSSSFTSCTMTLTTTASSSASSSSTTVSFSPKVDIVVYQLPVEHFASKGWSKYFTS
jgi:hypothetical protein